MLLQCQETFSKTGLVTAFIDTPVVCLLHDPERKVDSGLHPSDGGGAITVQNGIQLAMQPLTASIGRWRIRHSMNMPDSDRPCP